MNSTTPLKTGAVFDLDSIILVAVPVSSSGALVPARHTKPSYLDRMKDLQNDRLISEHSLKKGKEGQLRMVYMPRGDYLKYFAKDIQGHYCGTEPETSWTDQELNKAFGRYQPSIETRPEGQGVDDVAKSLSTPEG